MSTETYDKPVASARGAYAGADPCPIRNFDHVELFVGNAAQSAAFYESCFGFHRVAHRGLVTGDRERTSYVLEQGKIRLVLTSSLSPDSTVARSVLTHGDAVAVVALGVPDAAHAFEYTTSRGALAAEEPVEHRDDDGFVKTAAIHIYGDTLIRFIERDAYRGVFAPGFAPCMPSSRGAGFGLAAIDHVVGNVELGAMDRWVRFFAETMGFSQLAHFDDRAISTEYSALMSKVMQDGSGKIKFPINEPARGRRKSQIEEYLEYNRGPGVQHIACLSGDIIETVRRMRSKGVEFLDVPRTYYDDLEARVGHIDEPMESIAKLGILVDRDDDGYLLQIFTKPVQDRPTMFYEIIERHGARGFGAGNFKALFEAIEREQARRGNLS